MAKESNQKWCEPIDVQFNNMVEKSSNDYHIHVEVTQIESHVILNKMIKRSCFIQIQLKNMLKHL
jgi:hypothetical protein